MTYETLCESEDSHDNDNYCASCSTCHDCIAEVALEYHHTTSVLRKRISELESAVGSTVKILEALMDDPEVVVEEQYYTSSDISILKRIANINLT